MALRSPIFGALWMAVALFALHSALAAHPESAWDERVDPACCPYPEHDPRDYNWPYSHLQYSEVIPDVTGSFVPMTELNISFPSGVVADYGKPIPPSLLNRRPEVAFNLEPDRDSSTLHTLMMVDPDVPFRDSPTDGEWLHWLVYDIPGNDTARGSTLAEYSPPRPKPCPAGERLCLKEHRVSFILWEQPHGALALHGEDVRIAAEQVRYATLLWRVHTEHMQHAHAARTRTRTRTRTPHTRACTLDHVHVHVAPRGRAGGAAAAVQSA